MKYNNIDLTPYCKLIDTTKSFDQFDYLSRYEQIITQLVSSNKKLLYSYPELKSFSELDKQMKAITLFIYENQLIAKSLIGDVLSIEFKQCDANPIQMKIKYLQSIKREDIIALRKKFKAHHFVLTLDKSETAISITFKNSFFTETQKTTNDTSRSHRRTANI